MRFEEKFAGGESGLPGTGESTLSAALAKELRAMYLRVDVVDAYCRNHFKRAGRLHCVLRTCETKPALGSWCDRRYGQSDHRYAPKSR